MERKESLSPDTPTTVFSRTLTLVDSTSRPGPLKSSQNNARHWWRLASAFIAFFAIGWGDGSTGAILPELQSDFKMNFIMGSMLFMTGSVGYASATFLVQPLASLLGRFSLDMQHRSYLPTIISRSPTASSLSKGRHLSLLLAGCLHSVYFVLSPLSPSYAWVLVGRFTSGIGTSILIAQINVYWTTNPRLPGIALLHGVYGIGAVFSPLIYQILRSHGYIWRRFFWISFSLACCNITLSLFAFSPTTEEFKLERDLALASHALCSTQPVGKGDIEAASPIEKSEAPKGMWHIFAMPYVWVIATFLGIYQGAETVAQGFIVTFLLYARNANPNVVGYASSGFWAGLATGRCIWGFLSPYCSQRIKIYYINAVLIIGMIFHVLIWQVNSMAADCVVVALLGLFAGPTFPLMLDIVTNQKGAQSSGRPSPLPVLPAEVQLTALAIASSVGSMGGAIFPLAAGVAANTYGAWVVEPLAMASLGLVLLFFLGTQLAYKILRK